MSRKTSPARVAAFLAALRATGNQTLAAERARVSRSWVTLHRASDAGFDGAVREACLDFARHERDGRGAKSTKPPRGWGYLDGEELVVRGSGGSGEGRHIQIARARPRQWTPRTEARFLATLAATCNVKAACAEAGLSVPSVYLHRQRWPRFAEQWREAVETGYARIEIGLVETGGNMFCAPEVEPDAPMPPMTVEQAIHILHMHKNEVRGIGKKPGRWFRPRSLDEVKESILKKLAAMDRARALSAEDRAKDEREWASRRP